MPNPATYQFEYLGSRDGLFFLGLKGPRGNIRSMPLNAVEMILVLDAYLRIHSAEDAVDGETPGAYLYLTRQDMDHGEEIGIPAVRVIAERLGISVEAAAAWWDRKQAEAQARDECAQGDGAAGG